MQAVAGAKDPFQSSFRPFPGIRRLAGRYRRPICRRERSVLSTLRRIVAASDLFVWIKGTILLVEHFLNFNCTPPDNGVAVVQP